MEQLFLSTPSARRATAAVGGRNGDGVISIHALREEGDRLCRLQASGRRRFLSTPSARRATRIWCCLRSCCRISIHALREEGDSCKAEMKSLTERFLSTPSARRATPPSTTTASKKSNFYPRPPRGGRRLPSGFTVRINDAFLSTPSARRATNFQAGAGHGIVISIHALREEGDQRSRNRRRS